MKSKKILAVAAAAVLLVSTAVMPAGAVSASWSLAKNQTDAYSTTLGLYSKGNVEYLRTSTSSNDGVNLYYDYAFPGKGWQNAYHLFCDPGQNDSATGTYDLGGVASWRGHICSWYWLGTGCVASGKVHAYN